MIYFADSSFIFDAGIIWNPSFTFHLIHSEHNFTSSPSSLWTHHLKPLRSCWYRLEMRVNRAKFVRKYLRFFKIVYGLSAPYDVRLHLHIQIARKRFNWHFAGLVLDYIGRELHLCSPQSEVGYTRKVDKAFTGRDYPNLCFEIGDCWALSCWPKSCGRFGICE